MRLKEKIKYLQAIGFKRKAIFAFKKQYKNVVIKIDALTNNVDFGKISAINTKNILKENRGLAVIDCIDQLLNKGVNPLDIIIDYDNEYDLYYKNQYIKCSEVKYDPATNLLEKSNHYKSFYYCSYMDNNKIYRDFKII